MASGHTKHLWFTLQWLGCQHDSQMVTSLSLEGYFSSLSGVFLVYSICGRKWGKNSFLGKICVLGPTRPFSWNLNFRRNLSDSEIEDLEGLMRSLDGVHLSPSVFPSKFVWNSQIPFKVQSFIWLFQLAKMDWVPPRSILDMMYIKFNGFGSSKRGIALWQAANIALIRIVWRERNARIFEDKARNSESLWDSIVFLASLWAYCSKVFKGTPLMRYILIG
ncbi:hypothetical protein CK203_046596 [Vitis vinifera]|uniref:Reverse transcriptase zinc-binding domain-containing protein n=1 Tax=Vitis vinifera TaxID=29760 RepID=A0A438HLF8_VITVI|nr:hypothetical protein CK203_046596 [Vitis vinifera]